MINMFLFGFVLRRGSAKRKQFGQNIAMANIYMRRYKGYLFIWP